VIAHERVRTSSAAVREEARAFMGPNLKKKAVWCMHCERVAFAIDMRVVYELGVPYIMCAYGDCPGGSVIDMWPVEGDDLNPRLEFVPRDWQAGIFYPMYPDV